MKRYGKAKKCILTLLVILSLLVAPVIKSSQETSDDQAANSLGFFEEV